MVSSKGMRSGSHSLSNHRALHLALIAFVCVVMGLLSGSSPTRLAGADWPARQIDDRVEQMESPNYAAVPMVCLETRAAEDFPEELAEPAESRDDETDEDETRSYILRSDLAAFRSQTGLHDSPADRAAPTPFRLLVFSTRGSPSA